MLGATSALRRAPIIRLKVIPAVQSCCSPKDVMNRHRSACHVRHWHSHDWVVVERLAS
jgi:hypothetical protein